MQVTPFEIGKLKDRYVVVWYLVDKSGKKKRRRFRLKAKNKADASPEGKRRYEAELSLMGMELKLKDIWKQYAGYLGDRKTATDLAYVWKYMEPELGSYNPLEIDDEVVNRYLEVRKADFIRRNKRPPSKTTLRQDVNLLQCVLNYAAKRKIIDEKVELTLPPRGRRRDRWLEEDEIEKLLAACKQTPHLYVAVALLLSTAGRIGAVLELTWDRVDFKRRTIDLSDGDEQYKKSRAVVPINDGLLELLQDWKKNCDSDYVVEYHGDRVSKISKGFKSAVERAGIDYVWPHALRHTAAVHMISKGCSMERVSQYLGHDSIATTEKIYARFAPKHLHEEAQAVDFIKKHE